MVMVRRSLNPSYWLMALFTAIVIVAIYSCIALAQPDACGQGVTYGDYALTAQSLVKRDGKECVVVAGAEQLLLSPLSQLIDSDSAHQLMLKRYQEKVAAKGGVKAYETALIQHLNELPIGATLYLRPESAWALREIGVTIPISPRIAEMSGHGIQSVPGQRIAS